MNRTSSDSNQNVFFLYQAVNKFITVVKLAILTWGSVGRQTPLDIWGAACFGSSELASFFRTGGCPLARKSGVQLVLQLNPNVFSGDQLSYLCRSLKFIHSKFGKPCVCVCVIYTYLHIGYCFVHRYTGLLCWNRFGLHSSSKGKL